MFHREDDVLRSGTGIAVPGATVTAYVNGTDTAGDYTNATKATIYPTNVVGTPIANSVVVADANGHYSYYAPDGVYDEVLKYGAITEVDTYLQMFDLANAEALTSADAAAAGASASAAAGSATNALSYKNDAQAAATAAAASDADASASATAAAFSRDAAAASAATAVSAANAASTSESNAAVSETNAANSAASLAAKQCTSEPDSVAVDVAGLKADFNALLARMRTATLMAALGSPANTIAPAIVTGTPQEGQTLTTNNGTFSNGPTSYAIKWYSNASNSTSGGTAFTGEHGSTLIIPTGQATKYIYSGVVATNASGSSPEAFSNVVGPVTAASPGLATPTLTNNVSVGTVPFDFLISTTDYVAGCYLQWELAASLTPATNGDGSYTTTAQKGITFIDGDTWARLSAATGINDTSGPIALHVRILRDNESGSVTVTDQLGNTFNADASSWSADYTETIVTSSAVLTSGLGGTGAGTNKSKYIDVATPFHQFIMNNNIGAYCLVRATLAAANTKFHAEFTDDHFFSGGVVACGFGDGTIDFNVGGTGFIAASALPGNTGGNAGVTAAVSSGVTTVTIYANGGVTTPALTAAFAVGDALIWEVDQSTHVAKLYQWRVATSTSALVATVTLASQIPSTWNAFCGGQRGDGTIGNSDAMTFNAGGQTNKMTPTAGFGIYA